MTLIDAESLTKSPTEFEPVNPTTEWLTSVANREGQGIRKGRVRWRELEPDFWRELEPDLAFVIGLSKHVLVQMYSGDALALGDVASLASNFKKTDWSSLYDQLRFFSFATESSTTTTEHSLYQLLRAERRSELLRRLSPERRATYERIRSLREEIGPLDFDVVEELRELRENG